MKDSRDRNTLKEKLLDQSICLGNFELASGAVSDFYVDSKLTTLDPRGLKLVAKAGWEMLCDFAAERSLKLDSIGGLTMGADPIAVGIALESLKSNDLIQAFSVRKSAKKHGRHKLIEGNFCEGQKVVVVDDVVTTGGSTLQAIEAIRQAGGDIVCALVLVDRQEGGRAAIEEAGIPVLSLFTREELVGSQNADSSLSPTDKNLATA